MKREETLTCWPLAVFLMKVMDVPLGHVDLWEVCHRGVIEA